MVICDSSFEWDEFKRIYNKNYASNVEEAERRQIFMKNVNRMHAYRQTYPDVTFTMAINHLADRRIEVIANLRYDRQKNYAYFRSLYLNRRGLILNLVQYRRKVRLE